MPDTPYTQGFKAGMAWREAEITKLLEEKAAALSKIDTGHGHGSELMSIRVKTMESVIALIKGEK